VYTRRLCSGNHVGRTCHIPAFEACRIGRVDDASNVQHDVRTFAQFVKAGRIIQTAMNP
jgi:hypothetical protein